MISLDVDGFDLYSYSKRGAIKPDEFVEKVKAIGPRRIYCYFPEVVPQDFAKDAIAALSAVANVVPVVRPLELYQASSPIEGDLLWQGGVPSYNLLNFNNHKSIRLVIDWITKIHPTAKMVSIDPRSHVELIGGPSPTGKSFSETSPPKFDRNAGANRTHFESVAASLTELESRLRSMYEVHSVQAVPTQGFGIQAGLSQSEILIGSDGAKNLCPSLAFEYWWPWVTWGWFKWWPSSPVTICAGMRFNTHEKPLRQQWIIWCRMHSRPTCTTIRYEVHEAFTSNNPDAMSIVREDMQMFRESKFSEVILYSANAIAYKEKASVFRM